LGYNFAMLDFTSLHYALLSKASLGCNRALLR